jgi:hypothetical protein
MKHDTTWKSFEDIDSSLFPTDQTVTATRELPRVATSGFIVPVTETGGWSNRIPEPVAVKHGLNEF